MALYAGRGVDAIRDVPGAGELVERLWKGVPNGQELKPGLRASTVLVWCYRARQVYIPTSADRTSTIRNVERSASPSTPHRIMDVVLAADGMASVPTKARDLE
jgi:hypothetical protein